MSVLRGRGLRWRLRSSLRRGDPDRIRRRLRTFRAGVPESAVAAVRRPERFERAIEIVVPCFNHGAFLVDALASIEAQTWDEEPLAVTFVDDNSTDGSREAMRELQASTNANRLRIKVLVNDASLYQAGSLNRAIASSASELFVVLNADDMLTADCLQTIVDTYRRAADIFMLGGSSLWFSDARELPPHDPVPVGRLSLRVTSPDDVVGYTSLNDLNMTQSSCSFFRSAWTAVRGYAPPAQRVCEYDDRDFQLRVAALFPVGVYDDYPLAYYRTSSSQGRWAL
jgi:GT2 family glycosyltransferase